MADGDAPPCSHGCKGCEGDVEEPTPGSKLCQKCVCAYIRALDDPPEPGCEPAVSSGGKGAEACRPKGGWRSDHRLGADQVARARAGGFLAIGRAPPQSPGGCRRSHQVSVRQGGGCEAKLCERVPCPHVRSPGVLHEGAQEEAARRRCESLPARYLGKVQGHVRDGIISIALSPRPPASPARLARPCTR